MNPFRRIRCYSIFFLILAAAGCSSDEGSSVASQTVEQVSEARGRTAKGGSSLQDGTGSDATTANDETTPHSESSDGADPNHIPAHEPIPDRRRAEIGNANSPTPSTTPSIPQVDYSLKYLEVKKDIKKYIGKRVAWVGKRVSSESSSSTIFGVSVGGTHKSIYALVDAKGGWFMDNAFGFTHPGTEKETKRTPAAENADSDPEDEQIRLVIGTIRGTRTVFLSGPGMITQAQEIPDLKDVVLDVPQDVNGATGKPIARGKALPQSNPQPPNQMRIWTDTTGQHKTEAVLLGMDENKVVRLRKRDGTVVAVPANKLSAEDREYALRFLKEAAQDGELPTVK